jgi:hypothetical protein
MKRLALFIIAIFILTYFIPINKVDSPTIKREWTVQDSKAYAKDRLSVWNTKHWKCLDKLWTKESQWDSKAYNTIKVMGRNAGGIPQILGMSPDTKPTDQIDRGLSYIAYRYGTPCRALHFHERNWWY